MRDSLTRPDSGTATLRVSLVGCGTPGTRPENACLQYPTATPILGNMVQGRNNALNTNRDYKVFVRASLCDFSVQVEALDTYGMTPLHRMASNNLPVGARISRISWTSLWLFDATVGRFCEASPSISFCPPFEARALLEAGADPHGKGQASSDFEARGVERLDPLLAGARQPNGGRTGIPALADIFCHDQSCLGRLNCRMRVPRRCATQILTCNAGMVPVSLELFWALLAWMACLSLLLAACCRHE